MKPATQALRDTLMYDMAITAQPRLIAEWEYNRFIAPTVTVTPDQTTTDDDWTTSYDLDSVTLPFRPTAGVARLRADSGISPDFGVARLPGTSRYYPTPDVPRYSYFASLQRSQLAPASAGDGYEFDTPIKISVDYGTTIAANKIVVGFETGYAKPSSYSIQVSTDGNSWQTVYSGSSIATDGTVTIWHSGVIGSGWGGAGWDTVEAYDSPVVIQAVRLVVYAMDTGYSHADVVQISPRLENDLTPFLINYQLQESVDSPSFIAPLGKASSNTATVSLSNIDQRFNNQNANSIYYQMIEKKVRFKMDLGIDTSAHGGAGLEYVREFTMWADTWGGTSDNSTVSVTLKDSSVLLQEQTMPPIFLQDSSVGQIVWTTLDFIGMNNYQYTRSDTDYGQVIPFYWPSDTNEASNPRWGRTMVNTKTPPTTTIWDEFAALCEATQTALYFDEYDVLQIKAREAMFNTGKLPDWNLDAVANGAKLPDIVNTSTDYSLTSNQVELTYKRAAMGDNNNGFPRMEVVWTPQAAPVTSVIPAAVSSAATALSITLLASALAKDCKLTDTDLWVHQPEAKLWSFETDVNIEGEMIHYKGKEYGYYDASGAYQTQVCYQQSDQDTLDALNEFLHWKNDYTGRLLITERGLYGSGSGDHFIVNNIYSTVARNWQLSSFWQQLGTGWTKQSDGYITQGSYVTKATSSFNNISMLRQHPNGILPKNADNSVWYGSKIRFPGRGTGLADATSNSGWHLGGIHFAGDGRGSGYYLEVTTTTQIDGWEQRRYRNEFALRGLPSNGSVVQYSGSNAASQDGTSTTSIVNGKVVTTYGLIGNKGFKVGVNEDAWYEVDINFYTAANGHDIITVYSNGVQVGTWEIPANQKPSRTNNWRFGTYVRGPSAGMDIDYLFAVGEDTTNPLQTPDKTNFLDIRTGDYSSGFVRANIIYLASSRVPQPSGKTFYPVPSNPQYLAYDEFGPVVHEVRTFDAEFNDQFKPTYGSYLYLTNPNVVCLRYNSDASGAEFVLANASRNIEVVLGQDQSTYGSQNSVNWTLSIYGRVVYQATQESIKIIKDDAAIRRQGLVRTQFTSRYIQTDEMATAIGDWITKLWATGVDQVTTDILGNPLLQIGDLVTINYPVKGMVPTTHQYYITDIKSAFDKGYKTTLILRRAKTTPV